MSEPELFLAAANRQRLLLHLLRLEAEAPVACRRHRTAALVHDDTDLAPSEAATGADVGDREGIEP